MERGRFISLEGGDGAGKSTQAKRLADDLRAAGRDVVLTREPGGAPGAEEIRKLLVDGAPERWSPMAEALLHFAARREHLDATILPALERGAWVVCDRFADSTTAYQGYARGLGADTVARLFEIVVGAPKPDLTIILDLPVEEGLRRAGLRGGGEDRYENMDARFHEALRMGFLEIAAGEPERCVVIDARGGEDEVHAAVRGAVFDRFAVTA